MRLGVVVTPISLLPGGAGGGGGCRLSNWMANVTASSGAFSMIVTEMAERFRSSKWQKSERYGGASRGPAVGLAFAGHSVRCPGAFPY